MAQLSSPGVSVTVIDESFYTPAAAGTTPLIIVASAQDKLNGAGTGTATGTIKANAGQVYLLTSQKDLADTFGTPIFQTDASNNPVHAGELNEYGLQAAYSYLGVSNRVFAVRADIDLGQLHASADAPTGNPVNGQYWTDTAQTAYGIFEWNGAAGNIVGGQSFNNKIPVVITDATKLTGSSPKKSVGAIGDYAVVATTSTLKVWYKNRAGTWVEVGTTGGSLPNTSWVTSWPVVAGTKTPVGSAVAAQTGLTFTLTKDAGSPTTVTFSGTTLSQLVTQINTPAVVGVSAAIVNGKLELYSNGSFDKLTIGPGNGNLFNSTDAASSVLGIKAGIYYTPKVTVDPHTSVPAYKSEDTTPRPTGSVWLKTTEANFGAKFRIKRYNSATLAWETISSPVYKNGNEAVYSLDKVGGGANLALNTLYVKANDTESTSPYANYKVYRRAGVVETAITSAPVTSTTFTAGSKTFTLLESVAGQSSLNAGVTVTFTAAGTADDADTLAGAINSAGFVNVVASVSSLNEVIITHTTAGEIRIQDGTGTPIGHIFTPYNVTTSAGTQNFYADPTGTTDFYVASLWQPLKSVNSAHAPTEIPADGRLWYNSIVDEVDLMIHNGHTWVGFQFHGNGTTTFDSPYYNADPTRRTDPHGPQVSATAPTTQYDGTALVNGDIWISTADIENYPLIYRWNGYTLKWVLLDSSDQTSDQGVLFHDARWSDNGIDDYPATIQELLVSDFLDPDAPDPALYPKGMLLWNLRRSGFNVKEFMQNYIDTNAENHRYNNNESMANYYPHRWVSVAANQENGAGTFGRKAQRKVVIQKLQALVNANQQIRDEEARVFNLIACPGYPELIGEMISLNYDRGLTAFVVGDTPARLKADATTLNNWGTNQALALEDNDSGLVSSDEYLGVFYPWGYTSDNIGNNVVVPPSHMMLRTIALSDNVSYPWFAPAGTRRGGITNATAVGYVDPLTGEFQSVALNTGQRDTLQGIKVNPITFITGTGLVNYGQLTRAKNASALDRINVARLVIYLRRQLSALAKPYVFEPNDTITRNEIKQAAESLMLELVGQRALYDFLVVCDASNNTPSRIDRNELYLDIAIEPVKAVEFIYIPLRLKNTGEIKGLG